MLPFVQRFASIPVGIPLPLPCLSLADVPSLARDGGTGELKS